MTGPMAATWAACAAVSLVSTGLARRYALRRGLIDHPDERRPHTLPTPRGGGIGLVVALLIALLGLSLAGWVSGRLPIALALAVAGMGAVGWIDDHRGSSAVFRLCCQSLLAAGILALLGGVDSLNFGPWTLTSFWINQVIALLGLVWLTNLFNFMDGIDGLAACQAIFAGTGLAMLAGLEGVTDLQWCAGLVVAATIGYLPWNFPRARVFMGDVGSAALGLGLGVLALESASSGSASPAISGLLLALFVVDATATLVWRFFKGDQWYTAHCEHAYQRLVRSGLSHRRVTFLALAVNVLFIIPLLMWAHKNPDREGWAVLIAAIPMLALWYRTRSLGRDH